MAEAQGTPPAAVKGGVVAYLSLDGAIKAGELYKKAFAAEQVHLHHADGKGRTMHLHLLINGSSVMLSDPFPEHGHPYVPAAGFSLMLPVADVDSWWQRAVDAGLTPVMKPEDMFWGDRYAQAKDPFGVLWAFVGPKKASAMDSKAMRLTGYALTGAFTLFMLFDVAIKLIRHPMVEETMRQLGFPGGLGFPIGVIEAVCLVLYLVRRTAVLGAVLLMSVFGGGIAIHLRQADPLFSHVLFGVYLGLFMWGGLWLRSPDLRSVFPVRRMAV